MPARHNAEVSPGPTWCRDSYAPLGSAAARFADAWHAAQATKDKARVDELELFRKDVGSYVRLYDFLSQIVNYEDPDLEKLALFLRLLKGRLVRPEASDIIDLSSVELTHIKQARAKDQTLDLNSGETVALMPMTAAGSGQSRDPHMVLLEEVLAKVNALFDGEDFTPGQQRSWVEGLVTVLGENATVRSQAAANTSKQFVESPDLSDAVTGAVLDAGRAHQDDREVLQRRHLQGQAREAAG
ncbi:hypothetical protein [Nocardioides jishulii]|uniref:Uncharacterized protein n=1 Tax=Nocardioides jishulii TaxID=2575440 RepID=A0A4U2YRN1_9ACTN|nr:hypothetical protein [Nocardioides jishulii]QCX28953.1 hypothetical protein FCL41_16580 [Nocardioides jishulii]TKI64146.1 hypothetical protein FC770_02985 [Nocardioides jishulii]